MGKRTALAPAPAPTPRKNGYTAAQDRFLLAQSRKIRPSRLHTHRVPADQECPPLRPDKRFPHRPVPDYHCWHRTALAWHQVRGWPRRAPETLKKRASVLRQRQRQKARAGVGEPEPTAAAATDATEATEATVASLRVALAAANAANAQLASQNAKLKRMVEAAVEGC